MIYLFHPAARVEHLDHIRYYEQIRPGLGARYLSDFEGTMSSVCEAPHRFRVIREPNFRILSFEKFPYSVIFRDVAVAVELLSVPHDRQRPGVLVGAALTSGSSDRGPTSSISQGGSR